MLDTILEYINQHGLGRFRKILFWAALLGLSLPNIKKITYHVMMAAISHTQRAPTRMRKIDSHFMKLWINKDPSKVPLNGVYQPNKNTRK